MLLGIAVYVFYLACTLGLYSVSKILWDSLGSIMHLSFVSTTPGRAGLPGGFDNKFVPSDGRLTNKSTRESGN
jgi:hypothetical protein